ncbi:hypothetical protein AC249_AIPGENE26169, partial [Exaiptasia diaphana]
SSLASSVEHFLHSPHGLLERPSALRESDSQIRTLKVLQANGPFGHLGPEVHKTLKCAMICADSKTPTKEVSVKVLDCQDRRQHFSPGNTVIPFALRKCSAKVGDDLFLPTRHLGKNSTHPTIAGICIQDKLLVNPRER